MKMLWPMVDESCTPDARPLRKQGLGGQTRLVKFRAKDFESSTLILRLVSGQIRQDSQGPETMLVV